MRRRRQARPLQIREIWRACAILFGVREWSDDEIAEHVRRDTANFTVYGERVGFVRVQLRLIPTGEGGRKGRIYSGYRATWWWGERTSGGGLLAHDAPLTLESGDRLELGETATARLYPLAPELWSKIAPGDRIEMREGLRVVGTATVIESRLTGESA